MNKHKGLILGLSLAMNVAQVSVLPAQNNFYTVTDGSWTNSAIWTNSNATADVVPGSSDIANIRNAIAVVGSPEVAALNISSSGLSINDGASVKLIGAAGLTSRWNGVTVSGPGAFINHGHLMVTGTPSTISVRSFTNQGYIEFVETPSLEIDGRFYNSSLGTSVVRSVNTVSGTGTFYNSGAFYVYTLTTNDFKPQFHQTGSVHLGTDSVFNVSGGGTWSNANMWLTTCSVFQVSGGTNWIYGGVNAQGEGQMLLTTGQVAFFRAGGTTGTYLNTGPGGFHWQGGTITASQPDGQLYHNGNMYVGGTPGTTQLLQGAFINQGNIFLWGKTDQVFQVAAQIYNATTGQFTFGGTNAALYGFGPSQFHNSGQVNFTATGTSSVHMAYFQHGGTTAFHHGQASLYGEMYAGHFALAGGGWVGGQSFFISGGSVGGAGRIANNIIQSSGTMSPGQSPGKLEIEGFYSQTDADAVLLMELAGTEAGTLYDQVMVASTGTVGGVLTVELLNGYQPPVNSQFDLLLASEVVGRFAATNLPVLPSDRLWSLHYLDGSIQLRVEALSPDPDPDLPPEPPSGVSASDGTYFENVRVSWIAVSNAVTYEVWRNTVNDSSTASQLQPSTVSTSFDDMTALNQNTYFYWVKAVNIAGTSAFSLPDTGYLAEVGPMVTVNGMAGDNVRVAAGAPVTISVEVMNLPAGYIGLEVDWWVAAYMHSGDLWFYLTSDMIFTPFDGNLANMYPAFTGPLDNIYPYVVARDVRNLTPGIYNIWFALSYPAGSVLDIYSPHSYRMSRVTLTVE